MLLCELAHEEISTLFKIAKQALMPFNIKPIFKHHFEYRLLVRENYVPLEKIANMITLFVANHLSDILPEIEAQGVFGGTIKDKANTLNIVFSLEQKRRRHIEMVFVTFCTTPREGFKRGTVFYV